MVNTLGVIQRDQPATATASKPVRSPSAAELWILLGILCLSHTGVTRKIGVQGMAATAVAGNVPILAACMEVIVGTIVPFLVLIEWQA